MKERLVTLLLAAAALFLFYELIFPKPRSGIDDEISQPLSTDGGQAGELALSRWLQAEHIPATSLRYRYDRLYATAPASSGNLLLTVMPHKLSISAKERGPLHEWILHGNTLLVLAALDDTPRWAFVDSPEHFRAELHMLTGIEFSSQAEDKKQGAAEQKQDPPVDTRQKGDRVRQDLRRIFAIEDLTLQPVGEHPVLEGVHRVHGASELPASRWVASTASAALALLQRTDSEAPTLWITREGKGQIIVMSLASPFSNAQIDRDDNARLFSNIIGWSRAADGSVIFDDVHQGLTGYYDPHAFFGDPRLHHTLAWLVLLWLVFVLGPLPLRNAWHPWKPVDENALIDASSRFYTVAVSRLEVARRLFENFFNRLRGKLGLPENGRPLWEWLGLQASVSAAERTQLQALYAQIQASEPIKLATLQALLAGIQRKVI